MPSNCTSTSARRSSSRRCRRSRSRHRESRSRSRNQSVFRFKIKERNIPAAVCNMITIVILSVAMAERKWIYLKGGGCSYSLTETPGNRLNYLGITQFFYSGHLTQNNADSPIIYRFGPRDDEVMIDCVDSQAVQQMKTIIALCFTTIAASLIAFILDLSGPSGKILQTLHRYAIFSILTVVLCVMVNVLCYLVTSQVYTLQTQTKQFVGSKIEVTFDISFYLITAAGSMAVFAVGCNCFRRYPIHDDHPYQRMEEQDDLNSIIPPNERDMAPMDNLPPPPAYSPSAPTNNTAPSTQGNGLPTYWESVSESQAPGSHQLRDITQATVPAANSVNT